MARKYPRSPAQRAALRRAQLISARKRRRAAIGEGFKTVGKVAGTIAVGAAAYHANRALTHPREFAKDARAVHAFGKSAFFKATGKKDPNAPHMPKMIRVSPSTPLKVHHPIAHHQRTRGGSPYHGRRIRR